jgi:uncharacterized membrane protein
MSAIQFDKMTFPLIWNVFVAFIGTLVPMVWLRFISVGLASWPYEVVFIWFVIFFMELTAVTASVTHFAIERWGGGGNGKKEKKK